MIPRTREGGRLLSDSQLRPADPNILRRIQVNRKVQCMNYGNINAMQTVLARYTSDGTTGTSLEKDIMRTGLTFCFRLADSMNQRSCVLKEEHPSQDND